MHNIKFYRMRYDRLCSTLLGVTIALFLLNIGIFFRLALRSTPAYYATTMNGTLSRLRPLDTVEQNKMT